MTLAEQWREEGRQQVMQKAKEQVKKETMTLAEQWREEGRQQAMQKAKEQVKKEAMTLAEQWLEEDRQQAKQEAKVLLARRLLAKKMSIQQVSELTELSEDEVGNL